MRVKKVELEKKKVEIQEVVRLWFVEIQRIEVLK